MRVAVVAPDLRPGGGVAEKTMFVARSLRRHLGADVTLVSLATSSVDDCSRLIRRPRTWTRSLHGSYRQEEFAVDHCGAWAAEIEATRYWSRDEVTRRVGGVDVVHVVAGTPAWAWPVRAFRGSLVVHFASFASHERARHPGDWRSPAGLWRRAMTSAVSRMERAALRRASLVVAVNDTRRRQVEAIVGPARRVVTAHTGVDTNRFTPGPYREDGYLLAVGRLADARKNLSLLLRAYAAARACLPCLPRLLLAGHNGPSPRCWRLIAQLGLAESVEYVGAVNRAGLATLYQGASAFVLSSDEEGQGIVILEAMASGLPIVATACVGPPELITHEREGLLVPVGSVAGMTAALIRLWEDPSLRRRLAVAARSRAVAEFSLEVTGIRLCQLYRSAGLVSETQFHASPAARMAAAKLV
jgi:glycosyltransferase involved in cell wall biosynthesis